MHWLLVLAKTCEKALLLRSGRNLSSANALDGGDVDAAQLYFDFLLNGKNIPYRLVGNQSHDTGTNLRLYDGVLGQAHILGSLVDHDLRKTGVSA